MSDTIMQWSDGLWTALSMLSFGLTVLVGVLLAARLGKVLVIPALLVAAGTFYVRAKYAPLEVVAVTAMSILHICAGYLLAVAFSYVKRYSQVTETTPTK